jgi:leucyl/phenylalanyl-tRNA--protein transferase
MVSDEDGDLVICTADPRPVLAIEGEPRAFELVRGAARNTFRWSVDEEFGRVLRECAATTAMTEELQRAYRDMHQMGSAHSVEVWEDARLVAGICGVPMGGAFIVVSSFQETPELAEICLEALLERLREQRFVLLDCLRLSQSSSFGSKLVARACYMQMLQEATPLNREFTRQLPPKRES